MKKINQIISKPLALSLVTFCSLSLDTTVNINAENPSDYTSMPEYEAYSDVMWDSCGQNGQYALYDIDQDGIRELITSYGSCHADWQVDVYTLEEGKYVTMLDTIGGEVLLYSAPDGSGIYSVSGFQGYQEVQRITKDRNVLRTETIDSRQLGENEEYYTNDNPIKFVSPYESSPAATTSTSFDVKVIASDGGVNMRSGPGVEYEKVRPDMIPTGSGLTITQEAIASNGNSWGYTTYEGTSGWIALTQVQVAHKNFETPYISTVINCNESITLRRNPSVESPEICQIPIGSSVTATCSSANDFIGVEYQGMQGYCLSYYLSSPESYSTSSSSSFIYNVQVTAPDGGVNMRCGAGVEYEKVLPYMIPNGTVLCVTQEAVASNGNSWGYTTYNGVYGWIALTQVTSLEPTEGAPIAHTRYVINCNESITLRTDPDVNAAEICQIPLGTAVTTFGERSYGFYSVYYQGFSGYCLADYLSDPID